MTTRKCPQCGTDRPLSAFGRDRRTLDGFRRLCRPCRNENRRLHARVRKAMSRRDRAA
ncbi:hypothetical protein GCM10027280_11150 [Micromonospora polyrhachis]|uniref:CRISPR/Cas system-associated protein Cas10 (Large subunit of type III CRISPR-Cas system) n=1 Tax=Micromonospora polyrhachis TaxID=1282883 RepID=A0A7W7SNH7_9ACTN|nr:hypothetical protein [Micromonospora polyrhachis]MBB4958029.1 CRISPR/Cas system-associated protein Cas10 (large subunit of type III CRISPR-Cas system) [Micromonospora polyrhachis]